MFTEKLVMLAIHPMWKNRKFASLNDACLVKISLGEMTDAYMHDSVDAFL